MQEVSVQTDLIEIDFVASITKGEEQNQEN